MCSLVDVGYVFLLFVIFWGQCVACCLSFVLYVSCLFVVVVSCVSLLVVRCWLFVACCLLFVVLSSLFVVC